MKRKEFLIGLLLVFILTSGNLSIVSAVNYGIGITQNESLVWKCKVCYKTEMDNIFGPEWDISGIFTSLSVGASMKWKINSTEINTTIISIEYDIWYWTLSGDWGIKDNSSQITMLVSPNNYSTNYKFLKYTSLVPFLLPIPVGEYLGGLSEILNDWYDVDNRVLPTLNVEVLKDTIYPSYPNIDIKIIAIYNDRGILNSYKLYGKDNTVILDIALDFLPFYVIPSLIGLAVVFSIGIAFYIIKKKNTYRPLSNKK
ncbi:MAG: hypothetical protein KGD65_05095 [Candidatus Lokiarchaeota archaeon]|nr:hypothetical protein [Candidatus Lokiarchaeota archaeon]